MKALILAGGFGTRLKDITKDIPKPMVPIAGKPFLHHQIRLLKENGLTDIVLAVHHLSNKIQNHFGNGIKHGVNIVYAEEEVPLGTAGAVKNAEKYLRNGDFMVFNGDTYTGLNIRDFLRFHEGKRFSMALTTINEREHQEIAEVQNERVIKFHERGLAPLELKPLINTGAYIFSSEIFDLIEPGRKVSLEREIFPRLIEKKELSGYIFEGYFMDIGRPETYKQFKIDFVKSISMHGKENIREALKKMRKNEEDVVFVVDDSERLKGVVTRAFIDLAFINGNVGLEDAVEKIMLSDGIVYAREGDNAEKITKIMLPRTNRLPILDKNDRVVDVIYRQEAIESSETLPIFRAISPLRISFAGGGTDKEDYFTQHGNGLVISATIDKYCHATARIRPDSIVRINPGREDEEIIDLNKGKISYNGKWDLAKAVLNVLNPEFGFDLTARNDVSPGRGLGSSGSFAVMLVDLLTQMRGTYLTNDQMADLARKAEVEELKITGGWQDQYAAKVGGFNLIEFSPKGIIPSSLSLSSEVITELEESLLLCYVGKSHDSGAVNKEQEEYMRQHREEIRQSLEQLKGIAINIRDLLVSRNPANVREIGSHLHRAWEIKKGLGKTVSNQEVDVIYEAGMKSGATGGKLLGAGEGGYILFFTPPEKRYKLQKVMQQYSSETLEFRFERNPTGSRVWEVHK